MSIKFASENQVNDGHVTPVLSLRDYLSERRSLVIPPWQREYTWRSGELNGEGEVYRLLSDLQDFVNSEAEQYLLGVVTLAETDESKGGVDKLYIVDGQQRTVTLLIMFMCCLEYAGRSNTVAFEHTGIIQDLKTMTGMESSFASDMRVKFDQEEANGILQKIYTWAMSPIKDKEEKNLILRIDRTYSETQTNLLETRKYITERLEDHEKSSGFLVGNLYEGLSKILSSVRLIQLTLESESEALEVYDRMNDRGRRLNQADLIKNQLFMDTDGPSFAAISEEWNAMTKTLTVQDSRRISDPVFLVRSHASMFWGKTLKETSLAANYQRNYFAKKELTPLQFAAELSRLANEGSATYSGLAFESTYAAQYLGVVQHFPLILASTYINDEAVKRHFVSQIGTRAALASLSKEFPPQLESIFPEWAHEVYSAGSDISVKTLNEIYEAQAFKKGKDATSSQDYRLERETALVEQLESWRYGSGSQKRKIRASLALMSWWIDKKVVAENEFTVSQYFNSRGNTAWDIDHIGASAWEKDIEKELIKDAIGNLVLLEEKTNKKAQKSAPISKEKAYTHSSIVLTKRLAHSQLTDHWDKPLRKVESICGIDNIQWALEGWDAASAKAHQEYYKGLLTGILFRKVEL
jgi:hypothetical protein